MGTGARQEKATEVLRDLAWTIQRLLPESAGIEPLPPTELAVLKHVIAEPGSSVGTVARRLGLQQSNTSTAVARLERRGLVTRERSPVDGRITLLRPTPRALAERRSIQTAWSGMVQRASRHLTKEQRDRLQAAADALRALDQALVAERQQRTADER